MDKIEGFLEVGHTDDTHEVVINHPDLNPDENGVGHIVFSPKQARNLAELLLKNANEAEKKCSGCGGTYGLHQTVDGDFCPLDPDTKRLKAEKERRALEILKQKSEQHGAKVCTTDGRPPDPDYDEINAAPQPVKDNGQHGAYYVLCEEERAKGFVRPVRRSYRHIKCGSLTFMGLALAETYARDPHFYGATMCVNCGTHFPLMIDGKRQFVWINEDHSDGEGVGE